MTNKKERIIIIVTAIILMTIVLLSVFNWDTIIHLFQLISLGAEEVKDYVQSLGIIGVIAMSIVMIICFFFPFISPVVIQLASAISYGFLFALFHVSISVFIASQLVFLFTKSTLFLSSKKHREEHQIMVDKIKNSKRSIYYFLFLGYLAPFVPFLIIHMVAVNSGMKWWKYALITLLGPIPDIVVTLWLGVKITTTSTPILTYVILLIIIVIVVLSMIYKNKLVDFIFTPKEKDTNE